MTWSVDHIPSQAGRTVVVTGAGRGVGYFTAERLASAGAHVILTTRSPGDGDVAIASILSRTPDAQLTAVTLDVASLASIRTAAAELTALGPIDVLINNAGKTSGRAVREVTVDGLEIMVGTNAFGPFALTAQLFPALSPTARVIWLGSLSTRLAKAELVDVQQADRRYSLSRAYAWSKHGVHALALELDRRLRDRGSGIRSILAHPGWALDGTASPRAGITDRDSAAQRFGEKVIRPLAHCKDRGAWSVLRTATDPDARGGGFYGPSRSTTGRPVLTTPVAGSADPSFGAVFWHLAEEATGVRFDV